MIARAPGLVFVLVASLVFSVQAQEPVASPPVFEVIGTYPLQGQALTDQLVVYFNEALAPYPSAEIPPLTLEPDLPGAFEIGERYIAFRPLPGSLPDRSIYTVTVSPGVRSLSGYSLTDSSRTFAVTTHEVRVEDISVREQSDSGVVLEVLMSDEVSIDALRSEGIVVNDAAGAPVAVSVEVLPLRHSYGIRIPNGTALPVSVRVNKGVPDTTGSFAIGRFYTAQFPHPEALLVNSAVWKRMPESNETVTVSFSAPVDSEKFAEIVSLTNAATGAAIPFNVQPQGRYSELTLETPSDISGVEQVLLQIPMRVYSADLRAMAAPFEAGLTRTLDQLRISYHYWEDRGVDGPSLNVNFNGSVALDALKGHVRVEPDPGELTFEPGYYRDVWIRAAWKGGAEYSLILDAGIQDQANTLRLENELTYALGAAPASKGVAFANEDKYYFPQRHRGKLVLRSLNQDKATLTLHKLFPSNVAAAVEMLYGGNTSPDFDEQYARKIGQRKVTLRTEPDTVVETAVDLAELIGADGRGVYTVQLNPYRMWENTKVLVWTDIGAMAHWQDDALAIFAHNLFTLAPIENARVTVYSSKSQIMAKATTDSRGIARTPAMNPKLGSPRVAVIETDSDYAFLELENKETGDLPHAGMQSYDSDAYDVYMYADRNLYRPGEPVHLQWIVRTNYGDALPAVPLQFRLFNPNGQEIRKEVTTLTEFGTGGIDLDTKTNYATGQYTAEIRVPGKKAALQTHVFNLEEFVPNRIKTEVELDAAVWAAGQSQPLSVVSENLFGGPARNRKAEATLIFRSGTFTSPDWEGFYFGNETPFEPVVRSLGEARTGDDGRAAFAFDGAAPPKATFPLSVTVRGEVQELGGRAVANSAQATLFPSPIALGLTTAGNAAGDAVVVNVAAIKPDATPAELAEVDVTLERRTWHYFVRQYQGYNEPSWTESFEAVAEKKATMVNGRGQVELPVPGYGYYRVRVHSDATAQFSTRSFYKFWDELQPMDSAAKDLVTLTLDKSEYAPGELASLRIESPFGGTAVVCIQGESIYDFRSVDLVNNKAEVSILVGPGHRPNVWAEVTVIHAVDPAAGETHPFSSFAMVNLPVNEPARKIQIAYPELPVETRPAQIVPITVQTTDHAGNPISASVTVAAVDEGIHAILDYENPDPYTWFARSRGPALNRAEFYDKVAYGFEPPAIGGDGVEKRLGTDASAGENWIKPVALWSGTVITDAAGRATIEFEVPEFNGQLRIVAVAAAATATGATSAQMFVRRPYMLRTSMPRFALPGDAFDSSAVVFNTTANPVTARVSWSSMGSLRESPGLRELAVPAGGEADLRAAFTATAAIGQGQIDWKVEILDAAGASIETIEEHAPLPVRQPAVFQSEREFIVLQPGETRTLRNTKFLENDVLEANVLVSANPAIRLQNALKNLIGYPHGCVEQTTSRCMPLYLLRKSEVLVESALGPNAEVAQYLQAGIDRLFSMQTPSGGIGFWPGDNDPDPYGSVYAAHFFAMIRKDPAFTVPDAQWTELREYVRGIALAEDDASAAGRYRRAYAIYVLALDGDTEALEQIPRFDAIEVPKSGRHLLAAAIAMNTGDPQRARDYLADTPTMAYEGRETDGNLNSDIRSAAVELLALIEMQASPEEVVPYTEVLIRFLDNTRYPNTQDTAFAATALGRYIESIEAAFDTARCTITSPDGAVTIANTEPYRDSRTGFGWQYTLANEGQSAMYVNFVTAGIPQQIDLKPIAEGITIDRSVRAGHSGQRVANRFEHGDSYVVTLRFETKENLKHVVIADMLPAGFEIENPRLDSDTLLAMNMQDNNAGASYMEVRDDRLVLAFNALDAGRYQFHYVVRAVTPGTFQWPSVETECMYDPAVRGRNVPTTIEIAAER